MLLDSSGTTSYRSSLAFNHDPEGLQLYNNGYNKHDPRRAQSHSTPVGHVCLGQEYACNKDIEHTAYFADICLAWDIQDSVHGVIADDEFGRLSISVQRGFTDDYFDEIDANKLASILPILSRHLRTSKRLANLQCSQNEAADVFACLLTPDMQIATVGVVNPRISALMQRKLFFATDRIIFFCERMRAIFDKCSAIARSGKETSCNMSGTVIRFSPPPSQLDWMARSEKAVMLTIGSITPVDHITPFAEAHEFTQREKDLLLKLVDAHDLKSSALSLGIGYETARWHVKNMCSKAGYVRTSALVDAARTGDISRMY